MNNDHKNNLVALSLALDQLPERLPDWKFDMSLIINECGTAGCACGIAARLWPNTPGIEHVNGIPQVDNTSVFSRAMFDVEPDDAIWMWLFSGAWAARDNSPESVAARIRYFLRNGLPNDYEDQIFGSKYPLCYREGGTTEGAINV